MTDRISERASTEYAESWTQRCLSTDVFGGGARDGMGNCITSNYCYARRGQQHVDVSTKHFCHIFSCFDFYIIYVFDIQAVGLCNSVHPGSWIWILPLKNNICCEMNTSVQLLENPSIDQLPFADGALRTQLTKENMLRHTKIDGHHADSARHPQDNTTCEYLKTFGGPP